MVAQCRVPAALLALVCAVFALLATGEVAHAEGKSTQLTIAVSLGGENVVDASGSVTASGAAVSGADLTVKVNGAPVGRTTTSTDGRYAVQIDLKGQAPGNYAFEIGFTGNAEYTSSTGTARLTIGAAAGKLTASLDPVLAAPGQLVTVTGTLTTAAGVGVPNGKISFAVDKATVSDSETKTGSDGSFSTVYVIPSGYSKGSLELTAQFSGDATVGPTTAVLPITVLADGPAVSSTDTPEPSAAASSQQTAPPSAQPVSDSKQTKSSGTFSVPWLLLGIAGIAIFGGLITFGILFRDRANRVPEETGGLLDSFGDDDEHDAAGSSADVR